MNGYFMLVNASFSPGVFYLDTVGGLCSGTTYEFAAWVVNVLRPSACSSSGIQPNLSFNIETTAGAVLATYNSGNIPADPSPQWKQYGLFFTTPAGVNRVVIRLTNNAPGGCGNDLALDDITFRPCGPPVNASIQAQPSDSLEFCEGNTQTFLFNGGIGAGFQNPVRQWQLSTDGGSSWTNIPGATGNSYLRLPTGAGNYLYRMSVAEAGNAGIASCTVSSNVLSIKVNPLPVPDATASKPVCFGQTLTLSATDGSLYAWTGPNGFSGSNATENIPNVSFAASGRYYVVVTSDKGCVQTDSVDVTVSPVPLASAGADVGICEGSSVQLNASGGVSYAWSPARGLSSSSIANPVANPADSTTYVVTVYNAGGCSSTDSVQVFVWKKPVASAGPDRKIMEGQTVLLEGAAGGTGIFYIWIPATSLDDPRKLQPLASPVSDITYTLQVSSSFGCGVAEDKVFVRVFKKVTVPNAFSPNGDGINDEWRIVNLDTYPESVTRVFNRYGQSVFVSHGYSRPWDGTMGGKPLPVGVYYYVIDLKNDFPLLSGSLTLIR